MKKDNYIVQMKSIIPSEDLIRKTIINIQEAQKVEKIKRKSKLKRIIAGAVLTTTISVGSVGAYVAISGNTEILQKLGFNISQNYERNKQNVINSEFDEFVDLGSGIKAKLISAAIDNTNLIMEIDVKYDKDVQNFNPDFMIGNISINIPSKNKTISDNIVYSEKCSSAKVEANTWKIYKYISLRDGALSGDSIWLDVFNEDDIVNCKVEFLGMISNENLIVEFDQEKRAFEFELKKPVNLNENNAENSKDVIKHNNITIDGFEIKNSDFGNIVSFIAVQKDYDTDKINNIQKIKFIVKDESDEILDIVSKSENITMAEYKHGKFCELGLEIQIVVDDTSKNPRYTIEMEEESDIIISNEKINSVYNSIMKQYKNGEFALEPDGVATLVSNLDEDEYYVDEYGVYLTYKTSGQRAIERGEYIQTIDGGLFPVNSIVDEKDYYKGDDGLLYSNKTTEELYSKISE